MKTYTLYISGMHCAACTALVEGKLSDLEHIRSASVSADKRSVTVSGDFGGRSPDEIAAELSVQLTPHGYALSAARPMDTARWSEFRIALPTAAAFIALFIILQKLGIVNLVTTSEVGYGTAFLIGLIASVSTCMAVAGSLALSVSASYAKGGDAIRPQVLFHAGRLGSFFLLGGTMGVIGSALQLGSTATFVLNFLVAAVLLILGVNLLDVFPRMRGFQLSLPGFLAVRVHELRKFNHTLTPLLVGIATFFLPCGFTQSMQLYALSTGDFWTGAMTMLIFALGTLPVLAILSFGLSGTSAARSGYFFKAAGLVVIFFGVLNMLNSFAAMGLLPPLFDF